MKAVHMKFIYDITYMSHSLMNHDTPINIDGSPNQHFSAEVLIIASSYHMNKISLSAFALQDDNVNVKVAKKKQIQKVNRIELKINA